MRAFFKRATAWILAVLTTVILGVSLQTQNVIARLSNIGADVGIAERLSMTLYDLRYLGTLYALFVGVALLIAFSVGAFVFRLAKFGRPIIYITAGAVAVLIMLFSMKQAFFDIHMIAGARDGSGIGLQMLAGAIGGYVFSRVSPKT